MPLGSGGEGPWTVRGVECVPGPRAASPRHRADARSYGPRRESSRLEDRLEPVDQRRADAAVPDDPFDLTRFVAAQSGVLDHAVAERVAGRKRTDWKWFVFPQVTGLGTSPMAKRYAIRSEAEAHAYQAHPALGPNLHHCVDALQTHDPLDPHATLGSPDDLKLRSSMTLFDAVDDGRFGRCSSEGTGTSGTSGRSRWSRLGLAEGSVPERTGVRTEPFSTAAVARLPDNSDFLLLDSSTTRAFRFFHIPDEIRVVATWIQKLVSTGYRPAEIAIFARTGQLLPLCMCAISGSMPPRLACAMVAPH